MNNRQIIVCNAVSLHYAEQQLAKMHPNARRLFGPQIDEQFESLIDYAKRDGLSLLEYLKREQWDSLEQWYRTAFPYAIEAIQLMGCRP
jgi:hypothetical protein